MMIGLVTIGLRLGATGLALWFVNRIIWPWIAAQRRRSRMLNPVSPIGPNFLLGLIPFKAHGRSILPCLWSEKEWRDRFWEACQVLTGGATIQRPRLFKARYVTMYGVGTSQPPVVKNILTSGDEATQHKAWLYKFLAQWIGNSFLTNEPSINRIHRKMFSPAFNAQALGEIAKVINRSAAAFVQKLASMGHVHDMVTETTEFTVFTLCQSVLYHKNVASIVELNEYARWALELSQLTIDRGFKPYLYPQFIYNMSPSGRRFNELAPKVHRFTAQIIDKRMAELKLDPASDEDKMLRGKTFLDLAIEYHDQGQLTLNEIRDATNTILFAGHDTTAVALNMLTYLLGRYPEHQTRAREEVDALWARYPELASGGHITMDMLTELEFVTSCVKETLRLYPPVPFIVRQLPRDVDIAGQRLPSGIILMIAPWAMHRDGRYWKRPATYDPSRFLKINNGDAAWAQCAPFSGGARGCVGRKYAMLQLPLVLAHMLRHLEWESPEPEDRLIIDFKLIMHPRNPVAIKFRPRKVVS